jgi:hypothetical protein
VNKKLLLKLLTVAVCLSLLLGAFTGWYFFVGPGYYAEVNAVRTELQKIPQIKYVVIDYVDDITPEQITAQISVEANGDLTISNLKRKSFRYTESIRLRTIGPYSINVQGRGYRGAYETATGNPVQSEFYEGDIDIGTGGEFAHLFPFKLLKVQDVINHYEDILGIIAAWPVEPDKAHFKDDTGTDFYYSIKAK